MELKVADPLATGASLTAVTKWVKVTGSAEIVVDPPLLDTSTCALVVTLLGVSNRRTTKTGACPLKLVDGKNRSRSVPLKVLETESSTTEPSVVQVEPPSTSYCHSPAAKLLV